MAHLPRPPVLPTAADACDLQRGAALRRLHEHGRVVEAFPLESGVWRLEWRGARRRGETLSAAFGTTLRSALAVGLMLFVLGGAVTLCALTLVEIAERLVELGGGVGSPRAPD